MSIATARESMIMRCFAVSLAAKRGCDSGKSTETRLSEIEQAIDALINVFGDHDEAERLI